MYIKRMVFLSVRLILTILIAISGFVIYQLYFVDNIFLEIKSGQYKNFIIGDSKQEVFSDLISFHGKYDENIIFEITPDLNDGFPQY